MPARTGLLIIRAWTESGSSEPLRVTVRQSDDVTNGIEDTVTVTDRDAVRSIVDAFLRRAVEPSGGRSPGPSHRSPR